MDEVRGQPPRDWRAWPPEPPGKVMRITIALAMATLGSALIGTTLNALLGQNQVPSWWPWPMGGGAGLWVVALLVLMPGGIWRRLGRGITRRWPASYGLLLVDQHRHPSDYIFLSDCEFDFLPMAGGSNKREWIWGFTIVSCLVRAIRVDHLRVEIIGSPEAPSLRGEFGESNSNLMIRSLGATECHNTRSRLSDTAFHELSQRARSLTTDEYFDFVFALKGHRKGKPVFSLNRNARGRISVWGRNN